MEFKSLNDAFTNNFIKSLPHLTRLNLTANEKLIIELVLSFTHKGLDFYMNHSSIADYLVLNETKTKAKNVGNIIRQLKKKGYITTITTHNYNGKNGGSSTTIKVDEVFLEKMLLAVFNLEPATEEVAIERVKIEHEPMEKSFIKELKEMEQVDEFILGQKIGLSKIEKNQAELKIMGMDCSIMDSIAFKSHLNKIIRLDYMKGWKSGLQMLIENPLNWEMQDLRYGLEHLINQAIKREQ